MTLVTILFWLSAAAVLHAYLFYPALVWGMAKAFGCRHVRTEPADAELPHVTLLIAAHNEEVWIGERIRNALAMDYPPAQLRIVVASDGSQDRTNQIVAEFQAQDPRVELLAFEQRRGKAAMLNDAMGRVTGDIVGLSDANTMYEPDALRRLVSWFGNDDVGTVCGRLVLHDGATGRNVDSLYWRYETFLKKCEAKLGGLLGANGAIYAIRRELYVPIPDNTIIDDFMIPLISKRRYGTSIVYDQDAVAHEETPPTIRDEFTRRARIGAGGYQSLAVLWPLLSPRYGWTAFTFLNHKLLRWCVPLFLVTAMATNLMLLDGRLYQVTLGGQLTFYAVAVIGMFAHGHGVGAKLARAASLFCGMNAALAVGFWQWAFVRQRGTWQRTTR